jgi:hypothetical protein
MASLGALGRRFESCRPDSVIPRGLGDAGALLFARWGQCTENVRIKPLSGAWIRFASPSYECREPLLRSPGFGGLDDWSRGSWRELEGAAFQSFSSRWGVRATDSLMAASQRCRWYRTGELLVGNLRRQCTPGLNSPALRQRQRVFSLTPSTLPRERASTHSPAVEGAPAAADWSVCFMAQLLNPVAAAVSRSLGSLPASLQVRWTVRQG